MSEKAAAWQSPWVIGWIALVLIVLLVNGLMIFLAMNGDPGLVVEDYYERGQAYEKHMLDRQRRDPGWLMQVDVPAPLYQGRPAMVHFSVVDKAGVPVSPQRVVLFAYRPSDARQDFSVPMEMEAPGRYRVEVDFPLKGFWDTLVSVQVGDDEYNTARRIRVADAR